MTTGTGGANDGTVDVYVDTGSGFNLVSAASGTSYGLGSTVVDTCFEGASFDVQVTNPTTNAWTGSVLVSTDGGSSYVAGVCSSCSAGSSTDSIVVDGNSDGSSQAGTQCLNSNTCDIGGWGMYACDLCSAHATFSMAQHKYVLCCRSRHLLGGVRRWQLYRW